MRRSRAAKIRPSCRARNAEFTSSGSEAPTKSPRCLAHSSQSPLCLRIDACKSRNRFSSNAERDSRITSAISSNKEGNPGETCVGPLTERLALIAFPVARSRPLVQFTQSYRSRAKVNRTAWLPHPRQALPAEAAQRAWSSSLPSPLHPLRDSAANRGSSQLWSIAPVTNLRSGDYRPPLTPNPERAAARAWQRRSDRKKPDRSQPQPGP
jgi:hypothetical protein